MRRSTVVDAPPSADVVTPCAAPSTSQRKKGFATRWSLRRFIYSSPLIGRRGGARQTVTSSVPGGVVPATTKTAKDPDGKSSTSDHYHQHHVAEVHRAAASTRSSVSRSEAATVVPLSLECPLCFAELCPEDFCELTNCGHRACIHCLKQYLRVEITESRVCIACPECSEALHPNEIKSILDDQLLFEKYEDFMVRRVLAVDPDTRWCPAPDCSFAVIASECASCPKIRCERPGCDSYFCYHCKAEWHPNQTCDAARAQRSPNVRSSSMSYSLALDLDHREDIKACPRCQVLIVKMDDGSCNHMMCAVCGAEFCWLCMKEISDLHYLSPSGCTFWGKKPWSRKKKILWQLGTLVGAPVGIALVAGITVPAMIIGIPVWVGRKLYARYSLQPNNHKRNAAVVGGVVASIIISPILAGLAVGIGVPILLFYVYGVVPVSLCRSGGCGGAGAPSDDASTTSGTSSAAAPTASAVPPSAAHHRRRTQHDTASMTTMDVEASSRGGAASIGEAASLGAASGSHVAISVREEADRESASTVALAGSVAGWRSEVLAAAAVGSCKAPLACGESCICDEDCSVRFDDDVSFVYEGRGRCGDSSSASAVDGVVAGVEMQAPPPPVPPPMPQRSSTLSAELRSQFFALTGANGRGEESSKL